MSANDITGHLLIEIPKRFRARVWRRNVGAAMTGRGLVRFGLAGESDIDGIVSVNGFGLRLSVEVKAGRDHQSTAQASFERMILAHGGIYITARSVEQALSDLEQRISQYR